MTAEAPAATAQERPPPTPVTAHTTPVWLVPTLVAVGLGSWRLTSAQLWRDELASWDAATRSTGALTRLLGHTDAVSAVYYFLLHGWTSIAGGSTLALRLPSLLAMAATAGVTAAIGARVADRRTGIVAGLLFATVPVVSRYAQEARGYALTMCAFAVATWLLLDALDSGRRRRWGHYAVAVIVMGAFNTVALASIAGHAALLRRDTDAGTRAAIRRFAGAWGAALVVLSPLLAAGAVQARGQVGWLPRPHWLQPNLAQTSVLRAAPQLFMSVPVSVAVLTLAVAGAAARRDATGRWLATAMAPIALVLAVSYVAPTSYWFPRYLMFTLPAWAIAASLATRGLPRIVAVGAVVGVLALSLPAQLDVRARLAHEYTSYPFDGNTPVDYQAVASVIAAHYQDGDGVAIPRGNAEFEQIDLGLRFYLPSTIRPRDVFVERSAAHRGRFYAQEMTAPNLAEVTSKRIWVVGMWNTADAVASMSASEAAFLRRYYVPQWSTQPTRVMVVELLERKSGGHG